MISPDRLVYDVCKLIHGSIASTWMLESSIPDESPHEERSVANLNAKRDVGERDLEVSGVSKDSKMA